MPPINLQWSKFSFRRQLNIVFASLILLTACSLCVFFFITAKNIFLQRAFNLLELSHAHSKNFIIEQLRTNTSNESIDFTELSEKFTDRTGLGESGETYIINEHGKLLTVSRFTPNPGPAPIPSDYVDQWKGIKQDYRGITVLAVWTKIKSPQQTITLTSEIDEEEVLRPLYQFIKPTIALLFSSVLLLYFFIPLVAKALSKNVERDQELDLNRKTALIEGQEKERHRISMDLHDDISSRLTSISWRIAACEPIPENLQFITPAIMDLSKKIRDITCDLSADAVSNLGFEAACKNLLHSIELQSHSKSVNFESKIALTDQHTHPSLRVATTLYRIIQEASKNALEHAAPTKLSCHISSPRPNTLSVTISDDGCGFDVAHVVPKANRGMGLVNMKTRVHAVGGDIKFNTAPNKGCVISVIIPNMEIT